MPSISKGNNPNNSMNDKLSYLNRMRNEEFYTPEETMETKMEEFVPDFSNMNLEEKETINPYIVQPTYANNATDNPYKQYSQPYNPNQFEQNPYKINNSNEEVVKENFGADNKELTFAGFTNKEVNEPMEVDNVNVFKNIKHISPNQNVQPQSQPQFQQPKQSINPAQTNPYSQPSMAFVPQPEMPKTEPQVSNMQQNFNPVQNEMPFVQNSQQQQGNIEKKEQQLPKIDSNLSAVEFRKLKNNQALQSVTYPTLKVRFKAGLIDLLIDLVVYAVLFFVFMYDKIMNIYNRYRITPGSTYLEFGLEILPKLIPYFVFCITAYCLLHILIPFALKGQSIGKKICKIKIVTDIVDVTDAPSIGVLFKREFVGKFVMRLTFGIGYIFANKNLPYRKGIPDNMAGTHIIWA